MVTENPARSTVCDDCFSDIDVLAFAPSCVADKRAHRIHFLLHHCARLLDHQMRAHRQRIIRPFKGREGKLVASDRPDLHYRITLLNSPVVNAFALPSGQLYVTRGLIALANDSSELASVMSHEMAHVVAHHAEIREDRARQVALVSRMVNGVLSGAAPTVPSGGFGNRFGAWN